MNIDLTTEPLGKGADGSDVYLKDIWPSEREIQDTMLHAVTDEAFRRQYASVFEGAERWRTLPVPTGDRFQWDADSTYIRRPPFLESLTLEPAPLHDILGGRALAVLGDSITTDHISPAGSIKADSPAGRYLIEHGVQPKDFNSYGARRGNHEVMMRGTFANVRLKNALAQGTEGGVTVYLGPAAGAAGGGLMSIYDAARRYQEAGIPLVILAGKEYGSGSSREWAAKGTMLLGVKAVIAESFERIHRSNLVNMGVLPLEFAPGESVATLGLTGREVFALTGTGLALRPRGDVLVRANSDEGATRVFTARVRIDTPEELTAYTHGGILPYVLRQLVKKTKNEERRTKN
jgi:aconitate hydratase